jgi:hypothetical protein
MTVYIKLSTFEYPQHEGDIRREHPDISEELTGDTFPCPDTFALVVQTPMPDTTSTQLAYEAPPVQVNGVWQNVWAIRELTQEEIAARDAVMLGAFIQT